MPKSQSAMEYLMTYGWAILIIAVVLGALYSLGLFNSAALGPKAAPGSCQIYRPNGPLTTTYISLEGICNTEPPQYVAQLNGQTSYIAVSGFYPTAGNLTMTMFVKPNAFGTGGGSDPMSAQCTTTGYFIELNPSGRLESGFQCLSNGFVNGGAPTKIPTGTWSFIAATYQYPTNTVTFYVNGNAVVSGAALSKATPTRQEYDIGGRQDGFYNGSIADVQVYNTTLDANSILSLYQEGIGGAPINLQTIVGWWPLNGNANDYSGNLNNGAPTNVIYTTQWQSGYIAP